MARILFVDLEASSLLPGGFPIEVGWCDEEGRGEAHLIRPAPNWTEWSPESEAIHGLPLERLHAEGRPVEEVAARVVGALLAPDVTCFASARRWDGRWLDEILAEAGRPERVPLLDTDKAFLLAAAEVADAAPQTDRMTPADWERRRRLLDLRSEVIGAAQEAARDAGRPVHRALADAQRDAAIYRDIRRRAADALLLWRASTGGM